MINRTVEYEATHATSKGTYEISRCAIRVIDEDSKVARDWILRASLARQGLIEGEAPANVMASCERIPSSLNLRQLKDIEEDILEQFDLDKSAYQSLIRGCNQPTGLDHQTDVVMELAFNLAFLAWILVFIINY
ncbi:hypothetical protein MCOR02_008682 [Pyricularia oryzae]|nr:hypothetical protein MCOR02_008682 [Pyricularia oryzae]KAI6531230.1 hypothetical protein MCOR16_004348 [Pyricularia oryzae]